LFFILFVGASNALSERRFQAVILKVEKNLKGELWDDSKVCTIDAIGVD
jgi:hypothetical protein